MNQLGKEQNQPTLLTFQDRHGHSTTEPDPYFQPVDINTEGVIPDPDEQDPNLHDENGAKDEIKQEQVNINDPTEKIIYIENDEPIIQQPPILGDIPDKPNDNVRRRTRTPVPRTPYEPSMTHAT